jgi:CDP-diacylglycerol--glycerol-3-phosphate 3-phosphatidyltransferase
MQLGSIGARFDEKATLQLIRKVGPAPDAASVGDSSVDRHILHVATGYFNLTRRLAHALLHETHPASGIHLLTASPNSNGFWGAAGISGAVPLGYSEIERRFVKAAKAAGRLMMPPISVDKPGIVVYEYARPGWTFHAKGVWLLHQATANGQHEMLTLIGSPNYGVRSSSLDLELQFEMRTRNTALVSRLQRECDILFGRQPPDVPPMGDQEGYSELRDTSAASAPSHVSPVGAHLGPDFDVWSRPDRRLRGWNWASGWWVHIGSRIFAPFF